MTIHGTKRNIAWWRNRKIDWQQAYFTPLHPHRMLIIEELRKTVFGSLLEVGCAVGANLALIQRYFPKAGLGGMDVNEEAIKQAKLNCPQIVNLEVSNGKEVFYSDKSSDVLLTDMCLIYVAPWNIKQLLTEIKRVTRTKVIFVEFHHPSFWKRLYLSFGGYWSYNYLKLLPKLGFYDVQVKKLTEQDWPGGQPQKDYGFIITARV